MMSWIDSWMSSRRGKKNKNENRGPEHPSIMSIEETLLSTSYFNGISHQAAKKLAELSFIVTEQGSSQGGYITPSQNANFGLDRSLGYSVLEQIKNEVNKDNILLNLSSRELSSASNYVANDNFKLIDNPSKDKVKNDQGNAIDEVESALKMKDVSNPRDLNNTEFPRNPLSMFSAREAIIIGSVDVRTKDGVNLVTTRSDAVGEIHLFPDLDAQIKALSGRRHSQVSLTPASPGELPDRGFIVRANFDVTEKKTIGNDLRVDAFGKRNDLFITRPNGIGSSELSVKADFGGSERSSTYGFHKLLTHQSSSESNYDIISSSNLENIEFKTSSHSLGQKSHISDDSSRLIQGNGVLNNIEKASSVGMSSAVTGSARQIESLVKFSIYSEKVLVLTREAILSVASTDKEFASLLNGKLRRRAECRSASFLSRIGIFSKFTPSECSALAEVLDYIPLQRGSVLLEGKIIVKRNNISKEGNDLQLLQKSQIDSDKYEVVYSSTSYTSPTEQASEVSKYHESTEGFFIICDGVVEASTKNEGKFQRFQDGDYFGESCLLGVETHGRKQGSLNQPSLLTSSEEHIDSIQYTVVEDGVALRLSVKSFRSFIKFIMNSSSKKSLASIRELRSPTYLKSNFPVFAMLSQKDLLLLSETCSSRLFLQEDLVPEIYDNINKIRKRDPQGLSANSLISLQGSANFNPNSTRSLGFQPKTETSTKNVLLAEVIDTLPVQDTTTPVVSAVPVSPASAIQMKPAQRKESDADKNNSHRSHLMVISKGSVAIFDQDHMLVEEKRPGDFLFPFGILRDFEEVRDAIRMQEHNQVKEKKNKIDIDVTKSSEPHTDSKSEAADTSKSIDDDKLSKDNEVIKQQDEIIKNVKSTSSSKSLTNADPDIVPVADDNTDAGSDRSSLTDEENEDNQEKSSKIPRVEEAEMVIDRVSKKLFLEPAQSERMYEVVLNPPPLRRNQSTPMPMTTSINLNRKPSGLRTSMIANNLIPSPNQEEAASKISISGTGMSNIVEEKEVEDTQNERSYLSQENKGEKEGNLLENMQQINPKNTPSASSEDNTSSESKSDRNDNFDETPTSTLTKYTDTTPKNSLVSTPQELDKGLSKKRTSSQKDLLQFRNRLFNEPKGSDNNRSSFSITKALNSPKRALSFTQKASASATSFNAEGRPAPLDKLQDINSSPSSSRKMFATTPSKMSKRSFTQLVTVALNRSPSNNALLKQQSISPPSVTRLRTLSLMNLKALSKGATNEANIVKALENVVVFVFPHLLLSSILLRNAELQSDFEIRCLRRDCGFRNVLHHPIGLKYFHEFLETQFALENLEFYLEAEAFAQEVANIGLTDHESMSTAMLRDGVGNSVTRIDSDGQIIRNKAFLSLPGSKASLIQDLNKEEIEPNSPSKSNTAIPEQQRYNIAPSLRIGSKLSLISKLTGVSGKESKQSSSTGESKAQENGKNNTANRYRDSQNSVIESPRLVQSTKLSSLNSSELGMMPPSPMKGGLDHGSLHVVGSKESLLNSLEPDPYSQRSPLNSRDALSGVDEGTKSSGKSGSLVFAIPKSGSLVSLLTNNSSSSSSAIAKRRQREEEEARRKLFVKTAAHARAIVEKYVSHSAPMQINIESQTRVNIEAAMSLDNELLTRKCTQLFHEAQDQLYSIMKRDSFPRFKRHDLFPKMLQEILAVDSPQEGGALKNKRKYKEKKRNSPEVGGNFLSNTQGILPEILKPRSTLNELSDSLTFAVTTPPPIDLNDRAAHGNGI